MTSATRGEWDWQSTRPWRRCTTESWKWLRWRRPCKNENCPVAVELVWNHLTDYHISKGKFVGNSDSSNPLIGIFKVYHLQIFCPSIKLSPPNNSLYYPSMIVLWSLAVKGRENPNNLIYFRVLIATNLAFIGTFRVTIRYQQRIRLKVDCLSQI